MKTLKIQSGFGKLFQITILFVLAFLIKAEIHGQVKLGGTALDKTFGNQGKILDVGNVILNGSVSIQADGKILTITDWFNQTVPPKITRFNTDGSIDSSFGNSGRVLLNESNSNDRYTNIEFQADGKILVFGARISTGIADSVFLIKRLNYDGSLDVSFGNNGYVTTSFFNVAHTRNEITDVLIQPDGKIVAVGLTTPQPASPPDFNEDTSFALARYLPDGSPDLSFGNGGKMVIDTPARSFQTQNCGLGRYGRDVPREALLQSDGKIVVAGVTQAPSFVTFGCDSSIPGTGLASSSFTVMRFNSDGTLDNSFNNSGMLIIQSPLPSRYRTYGPLMNEVYKVSSQPNGKLLVSGNIFDLTNHYDKGVYRFNTDGSLDETFGNNGFFNDWNIEVLSSGKIITKHNTNYQYYSPCFLERYSEDGNFETILNIYFPNVPFARQINLTCEDFMIQPDDKIVVLGKNIIYDTPYGTMGLIRLFSDPVQPKNGK